jgi:hypothetical protein
MLIKAESQYLAQNKNFENLRKNIKSQGGMRNRRQIQHSGEDYIHDEDDQKRFDQISAHRRLPRKNISRAFTSQ